MKTDNETRTHSGRATGLLCFTSITIAFSQMGATCLPKPPPPPFTAQLPMPALTVHDGKSEVSQDGVSVTIMPIDKTNARNYSQVYKTYSWQEPVARPDGTQQMVDREAAGTIVPLP